tara:strand:+ start:59 stop:235 length:177 start_codon:yes stop_codon:yes gene_type:complete
MASAWIEHVKKVSKDKKISYKEAMKVAKASYKPKEKAPKAKARKPMAKGNVKESVDSA